MKLSIVSVTHVSVATIIFVARLASTKAGLFDICAHGGGGGCPAIPCASECQTNGDVCGDQGFCRVKAESNSCLVCVDDSPSEPATCNTDADCACGEACIDGQGFKCSILK